MDTDLEKAKLRQELNQAFLFSEKEPYDFITVYQGGKLERDDQNSELYIYSAFFPVEAADKILRVPEWELTESHCGYDLNLADRKKFSYSRHEKCHLGAGECVMMIPIAYVRESQSSLLRYLEINEEFRFYHDLHELSGEKGKFYSIDRQNNMELVAKIDGLTASVRYHELRQFLAVAGFALSIQFEGREYSKSSKDDLGISGNGIIDYADDKQPRSKIFRLFHVSDGRIDNDNETVSVMQGKRIIFPMERTEACLPKPIAPKKKEFLDFIIGIDQDGEGVSHTCNPAQLDEPLNKPTGQAPFLTPVYFKREVLDRYYKNPACEIRHGLISCLGLSINDTSSKGYITVYLGDLGQALEIPDQHYWKSFNIPPVQPSPDDVRVKRDLYCDFADSNDPGQIFRKSYDLLSGCCKNKLGWQLLTLGHEKDRYKLKLMRVLPDNIPDEFDKFFVSLNDVLSFGNGFFDGIPDKIDVEGSRHLDKIKSIFLASENEEYVMEGQGLENWEFVNSLNTMRNKSAHKKDERYESDTRKAGYSGLSHSEESKRWLAKANRYLEYLTLLVMKGFFESWQAPPDQ